MVKEKEGTGPNSPLSLCVSHIITTLLDEAYVYRESAHDHG